MDKLIQAAQDIGLQFGFNLPSFIGQIINFLIVAYVLYRFAFKPILDTVEQREKKIEDGLHYADEMKIKLAETERKYAETLKKGAEEAQAVINEAREHAKSIMEKHTQESVAKAEDIIKNARQAAEFEHEKMIENVRKEVAELVVATTSKVLAKELSQDERQRYSEAAARELSVGNN